MIATERGKKTNVILLYFYYLSFFIMLYIKFTSKLQSLLLFTNFRHCFKNVECTAQIIRFAMIERLGFYVFIHDMLEYEQQPAKG